MTEPTKIEALDFAALLCSRVCHDIISPVGAITNGLEVLDEEDNEEMKAFAFDLIRKSAKTASSKLQFARLAFGAAGSAGAEVDLGDAETVAKRYMEGEKADLVWQAERRLLPKNQVKLMLNLLLVSLHAVPRGGKIVVRTEGDMPCPAQIIEATGPSSRIPPRVADLINGDVGDGLDAHAIQPYYAGSLAREAGLTVKISKSEETVIFEARPTV
ncbi:histidine phosphotransferase ChpT [Chthonobacter rhizosphaerae]|uniref:histidine phosphotransferase ChpT n=1 Tax=Chthonobacter rhizosphaerae TaxID=2735553 RepID=UPI0015EFBB86|nr:histidine phosphotransferase family protein [Chthonobacter rhizosphaerae]